MEHHITILISALLVLGYGFFSSLLNSNNISGPMVFTLTGIILSPLGIGSSYIHLNTEAIQIIAEIALIIVLFSDASEINLKNLKNSWKIPMRLLFVALPLSVLFSTFVAYEMFENVSILYLLLMALILTPTDAALGKAVVTDKKVPQQISSSINVESGLNDGIVFPLVITVVIFITNAENTHLDDYSWIVYIFKQIFFGAVIGSVVGFLNAKLSIFFISKAWTGSSYKNLIPVAIAIFSYYLAEYFSGNGFISAYFSGLLVGNYNKVLRNNIKDFTESEGELLILISFLVFGLSFIPLSVEYWHLKEFIYASLSLTILRMLPVAISLTGLNLSLKTKLFIGWFGPRGIASILYVLIVFAKLGSIEGYESIFSVITLTILMSIFLHGITAKVFVKLYTKH